MLQVTDILLKKMTDLIVKAIAPQKVILFGSHARGTAGPGSDLDFMVIEDGPFGPDKTRENEMVKLWQLFFDYAIPLDFLVYSPEEIERWKNAPNHVVAHALKEGKILYERH